MSFPDNFGLYGIMTNPERGYEYLAEVLVEYEVAVLQLRDKKMSSFELLKMAEKVRKITEGSNTLFIMNDHVDIALDSAADGVHVGQDDLPPEEVRSRVGENMIVGLSTHNPTQTKEALSTHVDYVGVGPVYTTPTKDIPDPVLGLDTMKEMVDIATVPAVCLGGISLERLPEVLNAGARNFSLVRPLCATATPQKVLQEIRDIYKEFRGE